MKPRQSIPGRAQEIVLPKGFIETHGRLLLQDSQGLGRVFLELTSDPDHPQTNALQAYEQLLSGLIPGTVIRLLLVHTPDPQPRAAFLQQARGWSAEIQSEDGHLRDLLDEYLCRAPVPFFARTILEFVISSGETLEWVDSVPAQLSPFGLYSRELTPAEVQTLGHSILNPSLYHP